MALTFDRDLVTEAGRVDVIGPGIRRVLAPNPSVFTFLGTGTYIVGTGTVAVIDPGPADEVHIDALARALDGETVTHIVCTHTHSDHSPGSRMLRDRVGGSIVGCAPHPEGDTTNITEDATASTNDSEDTEPREHFDADHRPDWLMQEGDKIGGPGWTLDAVFTPGHIANHLCFAFPEQSVLFSGDHVMAWSTSVVSPPTGDLNDYLHSLDKVRLRSEATYWPTHGPAVKDPRSYVHELLQHRHHRTAQVIEQLGGGPKTIPQLVEQMYPGLDPTLFKAAGSSVLSHLLALRQLDSVTVDQTTDHETALYSLR
jgi:glyoxylase-like metal-dependent hydrolase (beta-lactamase superfamily II)